MSVHSPPGLTTDGDEDRSGDRPPSGRPRTRLLAVAGTVVAVVIAAAVVALARGGGEDPGVPLPPGLSTTVATAPSSTQPDPSTVTTPSTAPPASTTEVLVRGRYFQFWRIFDEYGTRTGPFDPVELKTIFGPIASGGEYDHLFNYFQTNRLKGLAFRGGSPPEEELAPRITLASPTEATILDCSTSSGETYRVSTGETVEPANPAGERLIVVMRVVDGLWKVTSVGGQGEPCAT